MATVRLRLLVRVVDGMVTFMPWFLRTGPFRVPFPNRRKLTAMLALSFDGEVR